MDQDSPSDQPIVDEVQMPTAMPIVDPTLPAPSYPGYDDAILPAAKRRVRLRIAATIGIVMIVIGVVAGVGLTGEHGTPVASSKIARLIHAASSAFQRTPSTTFSMVETVKANGHTVTVDIHGLTSVRYQESQLTMSLLGQDIQTMSIHHIAYLAIPPSQESLNNNRPWLAVRSLTQTPEEKQLQSAGPASYLEMLANVNGKIYNEGAQTVKGVATTKYNFHVNALKLEGSSFTKAFGSTTTAELKSLGFDNLPMSLWMDHSGLPRELSLGFSAQGASVSVVAYLSPSNQVPHVTVPARSQVTMVKSLREFVSRAEQLGASIGSAAAA
jgi:hypothetical protein